jgi:predicted RNA binding protein YcfA (HicA-like mRNA interferase family)
MRVNNICIDIICIVDYNKFNKTFGRKKKMPKRPKEMEKEILADGWIFKNQEGSHRHYVHPTKPGKVTIPFHSRELTKIVEKSIRKQAGLD